MLASGIDRAQPHSAWLWCVMCVVLALPALGVGWSSLDPNQADSLHRALLWTSTAGWLEPWRWWTCAWVHGSAWHLGGNLLAVVLLALAGLLARVDQYAAWAWFLAWPLVALCLPMETSLVAYGGLSGVLHAGVAILAIAMLNRIDLRCLGSLLWAGVLLKLGLEWTRPAQVFAPLLQIYIVPVAHALGVMWGCVLMLLVSLGYWRRYER